MPLREVVTVQLGDFANFIGAHFWNIQDEALALNPTDGVAELRSSVFFRESSSDATVLPYAPRLQIVDLQGAFGSLSVDAGLSLPPDQRVRVANERNLDASKISRHATWGGNADVYVQEEIPRNRYLLSLDEEDERHFRQSASIDAQSSLNDSASGTPSTSGRGQSTAEVESKDDGKSEDFHLDETVQFWSDYSKVRLHSKTSYVLRGHHLGVQDFSLCQNGLEALTNSCLDDMYDDLRFFVEESDCLGGLVVSCDAFGGFSGVGRRYLRHIRDELGSTLPILTFGSTSAGSSCAGMDAARSRQRVCRGAFNQAVLLSAAMELGAQYIPLHADSTRSMPFLHVQDSNKFQTSAMLGVALDVSFSCLKHQSQGLSMNDLLAALRPSPFAKYSGVGLVAPVTGRIEFRRSCMLEVESMRSLSMSAAARFDQRGGQRRFDENNVAKTVPQRYMNEFVSARGVSGRFESMCRTSTAVAIPVPFPRIFDRRVGMDGSILSAQAASSRPLLCEVGEIGALSSIYADPTSTVVELNILADAVQQMQAGGVQPLGQLESAELVEDIDALRNAAADYQTL